MKLCYILLYEFPDHVISVNVKVKEKVKIKVKVKVVKYIDTAQW